MKLQHYLDKMKTIDSEQRNNWLSNKSVEEKAKREVDNLHALRLTVRAMLRDTEVTDLAYDQENGG